MPPKTKLKTSKKYSQAIGRRKTASATARLIPGTGQIYVNEQEISRYFYENPEEAVQSVSEPLALTGQLNQFDITVKVRGGGKKAQMEAIRLAIARCLILTDEGLKSTLKKANLLTRDPRAKERKKPGLKRARRAPQWQKR
jgi:small subunit ribosomal protein S9